MKSSSFLFRKSPLWRLAAAKNFFEKQSHKNHTKTLCNTSKERAPRVMFMMSRFFSSVTSNSNGKTNLAMADIMPKIQRPKRKRFEENLDYFGANTVNVTGYSTAEQYDLESLLIALKEQQLYEPKKFFASTSTAADRDVLYASAKYKVGPEAREVFFFRSGSVVLWNFTEVEANNLLELIKKYERSSHHKNLVSDEKENVPVTYIPNEPIDIEGDVVADSQIIRSFFKNGQFYMTNTDDSFYHKYTLSDALSASIKLGIFESTLERYITSIQFLTSDLSRGRRIRISRQDMLKKTGQIFALRHDLNLSSDLLDVPDFYWDRDDLEALYLQIANYYGISKRTKVMNAKINHCLELAELIYHNLNDKHHVRLEWMIIILIMVEVGFEIIHFAEKYYKPANAFRVEPLESP